MADVRLGLHGQTADVDARLPLLEGNEVTDFAGRGVVQPEGHPAKSRRVRGAGHPASPEPVTPVTEVTLASYRSSGAQALRPCCSRRRSSRPSCSRRPPRRPPAPARRITVRRVGPAAPPCAGRHACPASRSPRAALVIGAEPARQPRRSRHATTTSAPGPPRGARPGFGLTELIASWDGDDPRRQLGRGRGPRPRRRRRDLELGRPRPAGPPATGSCAGRRCPARATTSADVNVDTWQVGRGAGPHRLAGAGDPAPRPAARRGPRVDSVGAVASRLPDVAASPPPRPGPARGIDARGAALLADDPPRPLPPVGRRRRGLVLARRRRRWCSATTTRCRAAAAYAWVPAATPTRGSTTPRGSTYDADYDGTGNWPFNTAYAAAPHRPRLRHPAARACARPSCSSRPASRSSRRSRSGPASSTAPRFGSTNGHLLVIVGFTDDRRRGGQRPGRPRQDSRRPAHLRPRPVRERLAARSGGLVYVISDDAHPLPGGEHTNW